MSSSVKAKSDLYFFEVDKMTPFNPKYISTTRPIMRKKKTQIPASYPGTKLNISFIGNHIRIKPIKPSNKPIEELF